jgi:hypothetical protein
MAYKASVKKSSEPATQLNDSSWPAGKTSPDAEAQLSEKAAEAAADTPRRTKDKASFHLRDICLTAKAAEPYIRATSAACRQFFCRF